MATPWEEFLNEFIESTTLGRAAAMQERLGQVKPRAGAISPRFGRYWESQVPALFERYMGSTMEPLRRSWGGEEGVNIPTFQEYLAQQRLQRDWLRLSPYERGERPSMFAPRMRFAFWR